MQKIISLIRKAVDEYNMIEEGDKIAIGLSGGKDSLTLLLAMNTLKRFYPKKFEIMALTIDPGSNVLDTTELVEFCKSLNIEYVIEKTNIKEVVFDIRKEKNPCSLCANLRRGALNGVARAHGCNKVALAHHQDDVMETFLLSLLYNGRIHTFSPTTYLSKTEMATIRPMIFVPEKDIKAFAKKSNLPVAPKFCPMDGHSKREYMKDLIKTLGHDIPKVRACIFGAITRSSIPGWNKQN